MTQTSGTEESPGEELRERVEEFDQRLQSMRAQVSGGGDGGVDAMAVAETPAVQRLDERVTRLEREVEELEDYVYGWSEDVETYVLALEAIVEDELNVSLDSYLENIGNDEEID